MDGELYVLERMMRDRIAEMRASAEVARLLRQSTERSPRHSVGTRWLETGRSLVKTVRRVAFAISRALANDTHVAKHPWHATAEVSGGRHDDDDQQQERRS